MSFAKTPWVLSADLPAYLLNTSVRKKTATPRLREALTSYERELIWSALQDARGNISKAASLLGIHRQQLQKKLKDLRMQ
jgi:transcriptional regulator with PAS, ATPase and Fis domain